MRLTDQIAKQFRDLHFGGNWTSVNLQQTLNDVTWNQATTRVYNLNTIAALIYHMHYYVDAQIKVLQNEPLTAKDKFSFDHPPIQSEQDWQELLNKIWERAKIFISLIEQMPESRLWENFADGKYGNYYRNIQGLIEHTHYHLGQVVLIKKILVQNSTPFSEVR